MQIATAVGGRAFLTFVLPPPPPPPPLCRALFSHYNNDPNCIHCIGTGTGGVEEMAENMDDAYFMYALGMSPCYCTALQQS